MFTALHATTLDTAVLHTAVLHTTVLHTKDHGYIAIFDTYLTRENEDSEMFGYVRCNNAWQ